MFSLKKFKNSLLYAIAGLRTVFKEEQSFRVQVLAGLVILILAIVFRIKKWETVILILVVVFVLVLELINSIFERVADLLKPRVHVYVETIKDIMAGAVLLSSLAALAIGVIIFWPYFIIADF